MRGVGLNAKGGGSMKVKLITLMLAVSPFALFAAKLVLGTKTGGMSDGGSWS
jgi:hypothetical protein